MNKPKKLLILGAGGQGKVCADCAMMIGNYSEILFLDDDFKGSKALGYSVIGGFRDYPQFIDDFDEFFVAVGDNIIRMLWLERLMASGYKAAVLIHPSAIIGRDVDIGSGSIVMAGAVISCDTKIKKGCIVNTSASIDHDNHVGEYSHIAPGSKTGGGVTIGCRVLLGIGCTVINNITVCDDSLIGAGAVVVKNIEKPGTYIGIPAKRMGR